MSTVSHPSPPMMREPQAASPVDAYRSPVEDTGKTSGKGTTSMVVGILGCLAFLIPIAALILGGIAIGFGVSARNEMRNLYGGFNGPTGRATAGMVLGIIACVLGVAMWVVNIAMMTS